MTLAINAKNLPNAPVQVSEAGLPLQEVSLHSTQPFYSLAITAVPFGKADTWDFPDQGAAKPGDAAAWTAALTQARNQHGGATHAGPPAILFGKTVASIASTPSIPLDGIHYENVDMLEWVVEAGDRIFLVQLSQEHDQPVDAFGAGLVVSGSALSSATSIGKVVPASQRAAQADKSAGTAASTAAAASPNLMSTASFPVAPLGSTLPAPPWWNGTVCDTAQNSHSYPLNSATVRGVLACGPLPENGSNAGIWGGIHEWQCTELSERYMYLAGYISSQYAGNGGDLVANYPGTALKARNSGAGPTSPALGDVVSMGTTHVEGHTALVLANHVDSTGNGYINILQQNFTSDGSGRMNVVNGVLKSEESGYSASWLHDPRNDAPLSVSPPAGGIANGGTYSGSVNVTGGSSQSATYFYLHLQQDNKDIWVSHPPIAGGTSFSYQLDTTQVPNGTYKALVGAVINGTAYFSSAITITINNATTLPSGYNVQLWGFNSGQTLTGPVTFSAHPSQAGYLNWVDYAITDANGYRNEVGGNAGDPSLTYPYSFDPSTLPAPGTYTVSIVYNATDGHTYTTQGGVFTWIPANYTINLWGFNSGQVVSGTLQLTAHASQTGATNWVDYVITGPNNYHNEVGGNAGDPSLTYPYSLDTSTLTNGTYTVSITANEIDGQNHTYQGGTFTLAPNAGSLITPGGITALYNLGTDGNVYGTNNSGPGTAFRSWAQLSMSGGFAGKPAVVQTPDGRITIFARTTSGTIQYSAQSVAQGAFGPWTLLGGGGSIGSDPSVVVQSGGTLRVYALTTGGDITTSWQDTAGGSFAGWGAVTTGGGFLGVPAAVVDSTGVLTLMARTIEGTIEGVTETAPNGNFGPWYTVSDAQGPSGVGSDPALVVQPGSLLRVYVLTVGGDIATSSQSTVGGVFSGWGPVTTGGGFVGTPTVVSNSGVLTLLARTTSTTIEGWTQSGVGGGFGSVYTVGATGGVGSDPAVLVSPTGTLDVYAKNTGGTIVWSNQSGGTFGTWQSV